MSTKLNRWVMILVSQALSVIETLFIRKIENPTVQEGLRLTLNPLRLTANALCDDNPRNAEQVEAIWKGFVNTEVTEYADGALHAALLKVEDEHLRAGLSTLSTPVVNMLRIVTDDNVHDVEQLAAMWKEFINDPNTHDVVATHLLIPVLEAKIKDPVVRELIIGMIRGAIEGGI